MSIKATIINDFLHAFKNKNFFKKDTLNLVKSKFTEFEKKNGDTIISDTDAIGVLQQMVKQRKQTIDGYAGIDSPKVLEAIENEQKQIDILQEYLPKMMSSTEVSDKLIEFFPNIYALEDSEKKKFLGEVMKKFKAELQGQYDPKALSKIVNDILNNPIKFENELK